MREILNVTHTIRNRVRKLDLELLDNVMDSDPQDTDGDNDSDDDRDDGQDDDDRDDDDGGDDDSDDDEHDDVMIYTAKGRGIFEVKRAQTGVKITTE